MLPCLVHLTIQHRNGEQSILSTVLHSCLIVLGLANFVGQFLVLNVKWSVCFKGPQEIKRMFLGLGDGKVDCYSSDEL